MAKEIAEKAKFEAEEKRRIQEATDEWKRLRAEAELLEEDDPENLSNRLRDFDNELHDNKQSVAFPQPISATDQTKNIVWSHQPETNCHNIPSINQVQQTHSNDNSAPTVVVQPKGSNLPKLKLSIFDGDPLKWPDWVSMFKSMVGDSGISLNAKMQHLQNSVTSKAKTTIEGYGYSGESYNAAMAELETRFGKPSLVIKATLGKLRACKGLQDNDPESVRATLIWYQLPCGHCQDLDIQMI